MHCTENPIYVFSEMKLPSLIPNSYNHVSVSDLYIHRSSLPIWLHRYMNVEIGRQNIIILFSK